MKFIVKPHPEVFVKSDSVRKRFIRILESNLRSIIQRETKGVEVINRRDHIEVTGLSDEYRDVTLSVLTQTPGIHHVLEVKQSGFKDMHDIFEQCLEMNREVIEGKDRKSVV